MNRSPVSLFLGLLLALPALAGTSFASGQSLFLTPSFQTAGVIIKTSGDSGNETVAVSVKGPSDASFHAVHPTTRFEPNGWATSLFDLKQDTDYQLSIALTDPDGVSGAATQTVTIHTRAEPVTPVPLRTLYVATTGSSAGPGTSRGAPFDSITSAAMHAQPGDQIRVLAGTYGAQSVTGLQATQTAPVQIVADNPSSPPVIDGQQAGAAFALDQTAYLIIDGFEIRNGGSDGSGVGLKVDESARDIIRNCNIHDNGQWNVLVTHGATFNGGFEAGFHLFEDNVFADTGHDDCNGDTGTGSNSQCPGQTYDGIKQDNKPGGGTVVRRNTFQGNIDNTSPCGDEDPGHDLQDGDPVLAIIGNGGPWTNHDMEFYDNTFVDARDDGMELDGVCVNARIWRNTINGAQNGFSLAPVMPGPYFIVRNVVTGPIGEGSFKMNTHTPSGAPSRNVFTYHNSFIWNQTVPAFGAINSWFAIANDHNVPIHNFVFRNNIFYLQQGGQLINVNNGGSEQPSFDGDDWFTSRTSDILEWGPNPAQRFDTFSAFQQGSGQEAHGVFGVPGLDGDFVPTVGSLVIDRAVLITGINDSYVGNAPDIGAFEFGTAVQHTPDAGMDAGADGGVPVPDGGTVTVLPDGGIRIDPDVPPTVTGCSCSSTSHSSVLFSGVLLGLALVALRRRSPAN